MMKKILFILAFAQFVLAPQVIKSYSVNSHEYSKINQRKQTVTKDIFGNTIIEDDKGNKKTIKKDIFGNTIIEDSKGNKKTIKKDIFGDTVIEDGRGNKKVIKKDIFDNIIIEDY